MFFPLLINLKAFPCLVIGGGKVAHRKVTTLQNFEANITVVSPRICKPLRELSEKNKIKIIRKSYSIDHLKNFEIVFCATDNPELNLRVYADCKAEKKLLNVADVPELCDFILPAVVKRGDLTIAVSSQGRAPFYASRIKNKLGHIFPSYYSDIIDIAGKYRTDILANKNYNTSKLKQDAFDKFFETNWKKVLEKNGKKKTLAYLKKILNDL